MRKYGKSSFCLCCRGSFAVLQVAADPLSLPPQHRLLLQKLLLTGVFREDFAFFNPVFRNKARVFLGGRAACQKIQRVFQPPLPRGRLGFVGWEGLDGMVMVSWSELNKAGQGTPATPIMGRVSSPIAYGAAWCQSKPMANALGQGRSTSILRARSSPWCLVIHPAGLPGARDGTAAVPFPSTGSYMLGPAPKTCTQGRAGTVPGPRARIPARGVGQDGVVLGPIQPNGLCARHLTLGDKRLSITTPNRLCPAVCTGQGQERSPWCKTKEQSLLDLPEAGSGCVRYWMWPTDPIIWPALPASLRPTQTQHGSWRWSTHHTRHTGPIQGTGCTWHLYQTSPTHRLPHGLVCGPDPVPRTSGQRR